MTSSLSQLTLSYPQSFLLPNFKAAKFPSLCLKSNLHPREKTSLPADSWTSHQTLALEQPQLLSKSKVAKMLPQVEEEAFGMITVTTLTKSIIMTLEL